MRRAYAITPLLITLFLAQVASRAVAQNDPHLVWHTLETPSFDVHYHDPLEPLAQRVAEAAERAQRVLSRSLAYTPRQRTHIVLTDNTDSANGSATALPFNTIRLYATAPEDLSTLADYDDWTTALVTHEHTHIVHLDQIGGIPSLINQIFGKVYAPNQVQPRWVLEGLAVHEESRHTTGGRIRSTMFDMYLRMDALEDRLLRIDQISNDIDRWPHGEAWYLYGSRFMRFVAERHGERALAEMSRDYGRQLVPYGLNRVARRATGQTLTEMYDAFLQDARTRYGAQRDAIVARGLREGTRITFTGEETRTPRFLRDGRVVYFASDGRVPPELRTIAPVAGSAPSSLARVSGNGAAAVAPDGRIFWSSSDAYRDLYFFNDLFVLREDGEAVRLTRGLRAQEPDVSPDGRRIAFTVNRGGTTELWTANTYGDVQRSAHVLLPSRRYEQVYTPKWSPDGRTIAYSAWREGGFRDICLVDVATGRVRELMRDRALDTGPEWAQGGGALYFSSDRSGIANVYRYSLASGVVRQVTNVLGGAFMPAVSGDGRTLVYVGYTSFGYDLFAMPLEEGRFLDAPDAPSRDAAAPPRTGRYTPEPYSVWPTILPHNYLLDLKPNGFGQELGITTQGADVVGFHSYAARIGIGLERGEVNADFTYSLLRFPTPYTLHLYRFEAPRNDLSVGGRGRTWIEDAVGVESSLSYSFPHALSSESIALTYAMTHVGKAEPFGGTLDPTEPRPQLPQLGWFTSARIGYSHSTVQSTAYDISPSRGRSLSFGVGAAHPALGNPYRAVTFTWGLTQYVPMPWLRNHVLAVRYAGGLSGGDPGRRGAFSIGGFPNGNLIDALMNNAVLGGVALRGYAPGYRVGQQYHLVQAEYRFPLWRTQRGIETLPVYVQRVHATLFADYGNAFTGPFELDAFRLGLGAELFVSFTLGYYLAYSLRIGIARGVSEGGTTQVYAHLGFPF